MLTVNITYIKQNDESVQQEMFTVKPNYTHSHYTLFVHYYTLKVQMSRLDVSLDVNVVTSNNKQTGTEDSNFPRIVLTDI